MRKDYLMVLLLLIGCIFLFQPKIINEVLYTLKIAERPHPQKTQSEQKVINEQENKTVPTNDTVKESLQQNRVADTQNITAENGTQADTILKKDTIWVETEKLLCGISEDGGKIISVKTRDYKYNIKEKNHTLIELIDNKEKGGANLTINSKNYDKMFFDYRGEDKKIVVKDSSTVLQFVCIDDDNSEVIKEFVFKKNEYKIGFSVLSKKLQDKNIEIGWKSGIAESEQPQVATIAPTYNIKNVHIYGADNSTEHFQFKKNEMQTREGDYNWIGATSKYFLIAIGQEELKSANLTIEGYEKDTQEKNKDINYALSLKRSASSQKESFWFYVGPTKLSELDKYKIGLNKVLFKGYAWFFFADKWFPPLCDLTLQLLIQLQKWVMDYGLVIIILTIILRLITYPLTQSSMKSMNQMRDIQPKITELRNKYKGNPTKMNQKLMEFYKKEGINPLAGLGGCLPMVLQMPIMIALYAVLSKAIELRGAETFLVPWVKDLSQMEILLNLGFNIPLYGSHFALLPVLMGVLMYFQNKATIKDPNQKMMIYMMPIMMFFMFNSLPAGLNLYMTFSSVLQLAQQFYTDRKKKNKTASAPVVVSKQRR